MFTGLVDDVGTIAEVGTDEAGCGLRIRCRYRDLVAGESVAVNGACLTVREHGVDADGPWFTTAAVVTTLGRTTIGDWRPGMRVNLERALRVGDRLGGHLVLGHVDGVATVVRTAMAGDAWLIDLALPAALLPLMVLHGSVTVDGVSLTVNALADDGIQLSIIDYTRRHTTLGDRRAGDRVHVEADVLAKHVERLLQAQLAGAVASARGVLA
jgi:riboflavin synthase